MVDHPNQSDPKGLNPSGQGPAQPVATNEVGKGDSKPSGPKSESPKPPEADQDPDD
jgi:hypothetical protein